MHRSDRGSRATLAKFLVHPSEGFCTAGRAYCTHKFWIQEYGSANVNVACDGFSVRRFQGLGADAVKLVDVCRRTASCERMFLFVLYSQEIDDGFSMLTGAPDVVPVDNKCTALAAMLGGTCTYRPGRRGSIPNPAGSYAQTCTGLCARGIDVNGVAKSWMHAGACRRIDGTTAPSRIALPCGASTGIENCDGKLVCGSCP